MAFDKARRFINICSQPLNYKFPSDTNKPIPDVLSEKIPTAYQPPTLTRLDDFDILGGLLNVPENTNGVLDS